MRTHIKAHNVGFDVLLEKTAERILTYDTLEKWETAVRKHYPDAKLWSSYGEERTINATIGKKLVGSFSQGEGFVRLSDDEEVSRVIVFDTLEKWDAAIRKQYPAATLWSSYGEDRQINATIGKKLVGYFVNGQGIIRIY